MRLRLWKRNNLNLDDMINKISLSKDKQVGFFISLLLLLLIANINNRIMVYIQDIYFYVVITAIFLFGNIIGKLVYDFFKSYYNRIITKTNMKYFLKQLTNDEKEILKYYLTENKRTQYIPISSGVINGLCSKKLVYCSSSIATPGSYNFAYNIEDIAFNILKMHPEYLE